MWHVDKVRWQALNGDKLSALLLVESRYACQQAYGIRVARFGEDVLGGA